MNKLLSITLLCSALCPGLAAQEIGGFEFEITTLGGQKRTQDDFKNNVLILDFWGTWCGPCKKAVPGMVKLYNSYKHYGLEIVGLNYRERGSQEQQAATVREFAKQHGITYTLALGTPEIRKQVIGFRGYPTMLFFKKGMKFDHLEVGFDPSHLAKMEQWVRNELGLDNKPVPTAKESGAGAKKAQPPKLSIPAGVIYRPGNHDTGFEFQVKGMDGKEVKFTDFRGKKVILVFTSTWDHESANTADVVDELHAKYAAKGVAVLAASMEQKRSWEEKVAAIQAFAKKRQPAYPILPVGLPFLKKVFQPSGIPFFLVFDETGKLILRRKNDSKSKILQAIAEVVGS